MIKIKLKCFSQVRYALDTDEMVFELNDGATSDDLEKIVREKASGKLNDVTLRVAINQTYISNEIELNDGDEVAFIPPVQGG